MALARWQSTIVDLAGNVLPAAQITVRREVAGAPLAVLYQDRDGTVPIGNPFQADGEGFAAFHAAGGPLRIDVASGSFSRTLRYVGIGLQAESDAVLFDISYLFDSGTADADPGVGFFRFNNATLASVTKIFVSETDAVGANLSTWLGRIDDYGSSGDRGVIVIRSLDGSAEFVGQVTGSVADDGAYRDVTVTHLASAGVFGPSTRVGILFTARGVDGNVTAAATLTDNYLVTGDGAGVIKATTETYTGDLDSLASTVNGTSLYRVATGATNGPSGAAVNGSHVITHVWDTNAARQIFFEFATNRVFTRSKQSAAWSAWGSIGVGKHTIWVPAAAMLPNGANPPLNTLAIPGSNVVVIHTRDCDATNEEYLYFSVAMPKGWNESAISFQLYWSHPSTTTNFGVVFQLYANAFSNDDTLSQNAGTPGTVVDTGGTTDDLYVSDESSAITIAGSPAENDIVHFRLNRVPTNGSDTLAVDARIHGIKIFYTTNSNTDE